jgi:hypothetical protein
VARATLLAQVATAALGHAIRTWVTDPAGDVDALIVRAFSDLRDLARVEVDPGPAAGP